MRPVGTLCDFQDHDTGFGLLISQGANIEAKDWWLDVVSTYSFKALGKLFSGPHGRDCRRSRRLVLGLCDTKHKAASACVGERNQFFHDGGNRRAADLIDTGLPRVGITFFPPLVPF